MNFYRETVDKIKDRCVDGIMQYQAAKILAKAYVGSGNIYYKEKNPKEASRCYKDALVIHKMWKKSKEENDSINLCLDKNGNSFSPSFAKDSYECELMQRIAICYFQRFQYSRCMQYYKAALKRMPEEYKFI